MSNRRYDASIFHLLRDFIVTRPYRLLALLVLLGIVAGYLRVQAAPAQSSSVLDVHTVTRGLDRPWSLAFLPDGRMLVTEKAGTLRIVTAEGVVQPPLARVPSVYDGGQGGLLDVVLDPHFAENQRIYFSYSEPRTKGNGTAVARAVLRADGLTDVQVIYRQQPSVGGGTHFGSRLVFARDGRLFVTLGDRGSERDQAQSLDKALGKVVRLEADGTAAADNPFRLRQDMLPEIWSYGHRNPQGAALHPETGELWVHEHGPQGGDEINIARPGRNYGWPVITYGKEYSGGAINDGATQRPWMEQPLHYWVPSIAPSGMAFYTANRFPEWRGQLFVGSLKFGQLVRLKLAGERVENETRYDFGARIRDVRQGPDGYLYLLTDESEGRILRVGLKPTAR